MTFLNRDRGLDRYVDTRDPSALQDYLAEGRNMRMRCAAPRR